MNERCKEPVETHKRGEKDLAPAGFFLQHLVVDTSQRSNVRTRFRNLGDKVLLCPTSTTFVLCSFATQFRRSMLEHIMLTCPTSGFQLSSNLELLIPQVTRQTSAVLK